MQSGPTRSMWMLSRRPSMPIDRVTKGSNWDWETSLYDHYKDSFQSIKSTESRRDRQFLFVIAMFAVLAIGIAYTSAVSRALASISVAGVRVDLSSIPAPAVLTALWVFLVVLSLRYCQDSLNVERQYDYLHRVEATLDRASGNKGSFTREGKAYLDDYPLFSEWAWRLYVYVFPLTAIVSCALLSIYEWHIVSSFLAFKIADTALSACAVTNFFLYRLYPLISARFVNK